MTQTSAYEPLLRSKGFDYGDKQEEVDLPSLPLDVHRASSAPGEGFGGPHPAFLPPLAHPRQRRSHKDKSPPSEVIAQQRALVCALDGLTSKIEALCQNQQQPLAPAVERLTSKIELLADSLPTWQRSTMAAHAFSSLHVPSERQDENDPSAWAHVWQSISQLEAVVGDMKQQSREDARTRQQQLDQHQEASTKLLQEIKEIAVAFSCRDMPPLLRGPLRTAPRYSAHEGDDGQLFTFPEVQVSVKVYQICNVDTSQLTFECDFLCRLDWCDPNVEGMDAQELASLDWTQYYNPHLEVANCKEGCGWLDGMDAVPRRPTPSSEPKVRGSFQGHRLRKTMRFRGSLTMGPVDLRCFPFDTQALPIKFKARRCHGEADIRTPAGANRNVESERVRLVHSTAMLEELSYWQHLPNLRGRGNYVVPTAGDSLLQFDITGVAGRRPDASRSDTYEVCMFVRRPVLATYFWDLLILNLLVMLAAAAFWDTAAPELSSRMSISLTVILTLAAYTSSRPTPIEKAPYVTFHDWCEQVSMFLVTGISAQNVVVVVSCGGQHEEAPDYMVTQFQENQDACSLGWCMSRKMDCFGLTLLIVTWALLHIYSAVWLFRLRRFARNGLRERLASLAQVRKEEGGHTPMQSSTSTTSWALRCCGLSHLCCKASLQELAPPVTAQNSFEERGSLTNTDKSSLAAAFEQAHCCDEAVNRRNECRKPITGESEAVQASFVRPRPKPLGRSFSRSFSTPASSPVEDQDGQREMKLDRPPLRTWQDPHSAAFRLQDEGERRVKEAELGDLEPRVLHSKASFDSHAKQHEGDRDQAESSRALGWQQSKRMLSRQLSEQFSISPSSANGAGHCQILA